MDKYIRVPKELKTSLKKAFRLAIDIGTALHFEIANVASKIKCELIGINHDNYLLADMPKIIDSEFVEKCNANTMAAIVCRYVYEGTVYGFRSRLIGIVTNPVNLIILEYPKGAEECNLRRYRRATIVLPSKIKFGTSIFCGSILDISEIGCLFAILNSTIDNNNLKIITDTSPANICLMLKLPGIEKDIVVPSIRRNVRHENAKVCIGLEYNNLDPQTQDKLKEFVAEMRKYSLTV